MSSKDRFQKRARTMQKVTGWSYSECLRLSREEISEEALEILIRVREGNVHAKQAAQVQSKDSGESQ